MTRTMKLSDIRIKKSFENNTPNDYKLAQCREYWIQHHLYNHDIVINNKGYLVDGYIQYLVLKENGVEDVIVKDFNRKEIIGSTYVRKVKKSGKKKAKSYRDLETLYVFGIHPRGTKERVWRVPNKFQEEWEDILNIGDFVMVKTKRGNAPIRITRIERLSECPVEIPVKRVIKKITKYNSK